MSFISILKLSWGPFKYYVIKGLGGWMGRANDYVITYYLVGLLLGLDYRVGGFLKVDFVIPI